MLAFVLIGSVGLGVLAIWQSITAWSVGKLERSIRAEVPAGCDRPTVEAWFEKHRIAHSWSEDTTKAMSGHETMPQLAGLRSEELSGEVHGGIEGPESTVWLIFTSRITIYFFFDKKGRKVDHYVDQHIIMP